MNMVMVLSYGTLHRLASLSVVADRAQVVAIRIMLGLYCFPLKYANVTFDKENICNNVGTGGTALWLPPHFVTLFALMLCCVRRWHASATASLPCHHHLPPTACSAPPRTCLVATPLLPPQVMNMVRLMHRLVEAVSEMEEDHQAVYLGITGVSKIQNPEARQIWEQPNVPYTVSGHMGKSVVVAAAGCLNQEALAGMCVALHPPACPATRLGMGGYSTGCASISCFTYVFMCKATECGALPAVLRCMRTPTRPGG